MKQTLALLAVAQAAEISCPNMICASHVPLNHDIVDDMCFSHDKLQPNEQILIYDCAWYQHFGYSRFGGSDAVSCDLSLLSGEFAWVDEKTQHIENYPPTNSEQSPAVSQLVNKKTEAYCKSIENYNTDLNNGRSCNHSWQCKSRNCQSGVCLGFPQGAFCSSDSDCNPNLYCAKLQEWPYTYTCTDLLKP